jgi:hypothetical protein
MRFFGQRNGLHSPVNVFHPIREKWAGAGDTFGHFMPLTGHTPQTILPDCFSSCLRALLSSACPECIERTIMESAVFDFVRNPARAIQASFMDCLSSVEINNLKTVFAQNLDFHENTFSL